MALQFVFGNSRSGKSVELYERVIEESLKNPGQNYLMIVPEQFTMETQKQLCELHPNGGILNIDVLSFGRLAHRVFKEWGGNHRILLDEKGKNIIIRKVAGEVLNELDFFGGNILKPGYISEVKSMISEFANYGVDSFKLEEFMEGLEPSSRLFLKLKDIKKLYEGFERYLEDKYITKEEVLDVLAKHAADSEIIKNSWIICDGFTEFTPVQVRLMGELMKFSSKVIVSIVIDEREDPFHYANPFQLFALSKKTIVSLVKVARENKVELEEANSLLESQSADALLKAQVQERNVRIHEHEMDVDEGNATLKAQAQERDVWSSEQKSQFMEREFCFPRHEEFDFLERNIFRPSKLKFQEQPESIFLNVARNPKEEALFVAGKIRELLRKESGYRYRDIAVIVSDMNVYGPHFVRAFEWYGLQYFMDFKKNIMLNSFVDYLRTLLDVIDTGFSYDSVFRLLRTGLFIFTQGEVEALDNYVRATGISGFNKWRSPWNQTTGRIDEEELEILNGLRVRFVEELDALVYILTRRKKTVKDITLALYEFLVKERIQEQLKSLEIGLQKRGEFALAKEYAQIYRIVLDLFDEFVAFLGDEEVSLSEYQNLLESGLEETTVGVIPPTVDQVILGELKRSKIGQVKTLFLVGVNDNAIPGKLSQGGLLSEEEREQFKQKEMSLSPSVKEQVFMQKFDLYLTLSKASEKLFLSLSKNTMEGVALRESYLLAEIRKRFPLIQGSDVENLPLEKREIVPEIALQNFAYGLGNRAYIFGKSWKELYSSYLNWQDVAKLNKASINGELGQVSHRETLDKIIDNGFYRNKRASISGEEILSLYGDGGRISVSRLERFVACPYQHFLTYGLRIREGEEYGFEAVDLGVIAHEAIERFSKGARDLGVSWENMDEETKIELVESSVDASVLNYGNQILQSSKRYEYMIARIKKMIHRCVWALSAGMEKSDFVPYDFEMEFAGGKIDRVDISQDEEKIYVKVMDYKTGSKSFEFASFYQGLQLQLPVYLNAAIEIQKEKNPDKEVVPAGFLYYQIRDPLVEKKDGDSITKDLLKKLQPDGIVSGEEEVLERLERDYSKTSNLIPGATKQISKEEFEVLLDYTKFKGESIKEKMFQGVVDVAPYQLGKESGCDFCKFKNVCRFDPMIEGFRYNKFSKMDKKTAFDLMEGSL